MLNEATLNGLIFPRKYFRGRQIFNFSKFCTDIIFWSYKITWRGFLHKKYLHVVLLRFTIWRQKLVENRYLPLSLSFQIPKLLSLLSAFCNPFSFFRYFFWYFAQIKFHGGEVLWYFARIIIHRKGQNTQKLQNIIRTKINNLKLNFTRYFSHHERNTSRNVASLKILVHDVINLSHTDDDDIIII